MSATTRLPKPPREIPACRDRTGLAPAFDRKLDRVLERMRAKGRRPMIAETTRTDARAKYLHGFGRFYDDGRGIVTNAVDASSTYHGYGLAADIVDEVQGWDAPPGFWADLREAATAEGLTSGDDWDRDGIPVEEDEDEHMSDKPHVQFPHRKSPSPTARALYRKGKIREVWDMAGAR